MNECELITFVTTLACAISKCYSDEEIDLLSAVFSQLGDTLATILIQRDINNKDKESNDSNLDCKN